eukprot:TRINITY_DN67620_c1_g10_i1.p1 TRINITY_DN67620_c1_g10~~TRINITY_DN67620_c1_g10_i1.p1  ORF type:complete len:561 (-),score=-3.87 TRINITY_DN67620_c1_g10_i1:128-1810(-)
MCASACVNSNVLDTNYRILTLAHQALHDHAELLRQYFLLAHATSTAFSAVSSSQAFAGPQQNCCDENTNTCLTPHQPTAPTPLFQRQEDAVDSLQIPELPVHPACDLPTCDQPLAEPSNPYDLACSMPNVTTVPQRDDSAVCCTPTPSVSLGGTQQTDSLTVSHGDTPMAKRVSPPTRLKEWPIHGELPTTSSGALSRTHKQCPRGIVMFSVCCLQQPHATTVGSQTNSTVRRTFQLCHSHTVHVSAPLVVSTATQTVSSSVTSTATQVPVCSPPIQTSLGGTGAKKHDSPSKFGLVGSSPYTPSTDDIGDFAREIQHLHSLELECKSECTSCTNTPMNYQPPLELDVDNEWGPMPPPGCYSPSTNSSDGPIPNWSWSYPNKEPEWDHPKLPVSPMVERDSRPFPQLTWPLPCGVPMRLNSVGFEGDLTKAQVKKLRKLFKGWEARSAHDADVHLLFINTQGFPMEQMQYLNRSRIFATLAPHRGEGRIPQSKYLPSYVVTFVLQGDTKYQSLSFEAYADKGGWLTLENSDIPTVWQQPDHTDNSWPEVETWPTLPYLFG